MNDTTLVLFKSGESDMTKLNKFENQIFWSYSSINFITLVNSNLQFLKMFEFKIQFKIQNNIYEREITKLTNIC